MGNLLKDFENRIVEHFKNQEGIVRYLQIGARRNPNILVVETPNGKLTFYVKESTIDKGFWGLNPKFAK